MGRFKKFDSRFRKHKPTYDHEYGEPEKPPREVLSKVIIRINNDKDKRHFLIDALLSLHTFTTELPAFLFQARTKPTLSECSRLPPMEAKRFMKHMMETAESPDIVKWVERSHEIVVSVRGNFNAHWFYTLVNVMQRFLEKTKHTPVVVIYANGFTKDGKHPRPKKKKPTNTYANRPKPLQFKPSPRRGRR